MHERSLVSVKVEPRFSFKLSTFYLASTLFTRLKLTCVAKNASVEINLQTSFRRETRVVARKTTAVFSGVSQVNLNQISQWSGCLTKRFECNEKLTD